MKIALYAAFFLLAAAACKSSSPTHTEQTTTVRATGAAKNELPVTILPGTDATAEEDAGEHYKYPTSIPATVNTQTVALAAYGAARNVWLGPKDWTGNGSAATNGGKKVELYPKGGEKLDGPHVIYYSESRCFGCMVGQAALYFPQALKDYNENYNDDGTNPIKVPMGLTIQRISDNLVTYTLPSFNGLRTNGAVYYRNDSTETYFVEATFVLPPSQAQLSEALTREFISDMSSDK